VNVPSRLRASLVVGLALVAFTLPTGLHGLSVGIPAPLADHAATVAPGPASPAKSLPTVSPAVVGCPPPPPPPLGYGYVGNILPPSPLPGQQFPCNIVDWDEVHGTIFSNQPYSAERFTLPVYLPPDSATVTQSTNNYEMYVGMPVAGDANSNGGQSYAEITFTPNGLGGWVDQPAVWSFVNDSHYGGNANESYAPVCALDNNTMPVSWQNAYWCVVNEVLWNASFVPETFTGGTWVTVTFAGDVRATTGLDLWVNDTSDSLLSESYQFNASGTGTHTFDPLYNSSCVDRCLLNWTFPFGVGVGLWPANYNESFWEDAAPIAYGVPHFWSGGSYSGDYAFFAPESTSGVCNQVASPNQVASCSGFDAAPNDGFYPWFTFNGTDIDFGANYSYTTVNWGGSLSQFNAFAGFSDLKPLFVLAPTNTSRVGFSPPSVPIWVNATLQDWGNVTGAVVNYDLNGGAFTALPMTLVSGTTANGFWSAEIPSSAGNGVLDYNITASNHAGVKLFSPPSPVYNVIQRGPLPTFNVTLETNLQTCGGVVFNGTVYPNGSVVKVLPGIYPAFASGCFPWNFTTWVASPGAGVLNGAYTSRSISVAISANNVVLDARWVYVRPNDTVNLATVEGSTPASCGTISIGAGSGSNGGVIAVPDGISYALSQTGCSNFLFAGWTFVGNFSILGGQFTAHGNGTLTANFAPSSNANALNFVTEPSNCGGIFYRGAGYTSGQSLSVSTGTYPLAPDPCQHFGFLEWQTSGALTTSGNNVTVSGPGTLTEVNYHLTEVTFIVSPDSCGYIQFDGFNYHSGAVLSVTNNTTHLAYPVNYSSCHLIAFTATGGLTLNGNIVIANGSGELIATFGNGPANGIVTFLTDPSNCGAVVLNGVAYQDSNFTSEAQGLALTVTAEPCGGFGFVRWVTYGPITVVGSTAWINGSGALEAVFMPLTEIIFLTTPSTCGTVVFNGANYSGASNTVFVPLTTSYSLGAVPCAGYKFSYWENTSGLTVGGGRVYVNAGGILTAIFVPIVYAVTFETNPATCGSVQLNGGQHVTNGTTLELLGGAYTITPIPCTGDHLTEWVTDGNVSVSGTYLNVAGPGNVTAFYLPVPPTVELYVADSTLVGAETPIAATVAVLVPPFNYNYSWSFGDGSAYTTPANFTSHTYHSTGTFTVTVSVRDPYGRVANASATISVEPTSATSSLQTTPFELASFGVIGAALLAILLIALWRARSERNAAEPAQGIPPHGPSSSTGTEPKP